MSLEQWRGWFTKKLSHLYREQQGDSIVFLLSVPEKHSELLERLVQEYQERLVIVYTQALVEEAFLYQQMGAKIASLENSLWFYTKGVRLLTSAKLILADDFYEFLEDLELSSETRVIQLWHTNNSVKKLGAQAHFWQRKSEEEKERLRRSTSVFTDFVVSSKKMGEMFQQAFFAKEEQLQVLGLSSTDSYFQENFHEMAHTQFYARFPELEGKKTVLYAPTCRGRKSAKLALGFQQMEEVLTDEVHLFVKPHPTEEESVESFGYFPHSSADLRGLSLPILLANVDVLITDYSSILFDYALANPYGKVLFYHYDFASIQRQIGLDEAFLENLPGEVVTTQGELMRVLTRWIPERELVLNQSFTSLNEVWNEKNDGHATERLFQWIVRIEAGLEQETESFFPRRRGKEKVTV